MLTPRRIAIGAVTFVASAVAGGYEAVRGEEAPACIGCLSNREIDERLPGAPEQETRRAA